MTRLVVAAMLGAGWSAAAWRFARPLFAAPVFARRNVRGDDVPVGVGVLAALGAVGAVACLGVVDVARDQHPPTTGPTVLVLLTTLGFAVLGIVDDLAGDHADKGFRGHLRALGQGRLTTGSLKAIGGGLVAVAVVATFAANVLDVAVGAAVVALAANTANLFDRAPGRVTKVGLVAAVVLVAASSVDDRAALVGVVAVMGAALGLFGFDLRERLMLGDAGANALGAGLGLGVVLTTGLGVQTVVLAFLLAANVAGERVSFTAVIERIAPLRALDRAGRRPL
ncbi:MAG: hypothetical protein ACR2MB_02755 [Acidimicrobiales bacterium]